MQCGTFLPNVANLPGGAKLPGRTLAERTAGERAPALLDGLALAIALDLALVQFFPVAHDLDLVEHSHPLVFWYGFPLVWLAGPEPGDLVSRPIRNWALPALACDMLLLCAAPLAVRSWLMRLASPTVWKRPAEGMPLQKVACQGVAFSLRQMLWGLGCYELGCALWLSPQWSFLCTRWTCKLVINRGLLGSFAYVPFVLPAILFTSIALAVLGELTFSSARREWLRRHRPRYRPGGELPPPSPTAHGIPGATRLGNR